MTITTPSSSSRKFNAVAGADIADLLAMPTAADIEFEPRRLGRILFPPTDFS